MVRGIGILMLGMLQLVSHIVNGNQISTRVLYSDYGICTIL